MSKFATRDFRSDFVKVWDKRPILEGGEYKYEYSYPIFTRVEPVLEMTYDEWIMFSKGQFFPSGLALIEGGLVELMDPVPNVFLQAGHALVAILGFITFFFLFGGYKIWN